jgi:hypothetical protein
VFQPTLRMAGLPITLALVRSMYSSRKAAELPRRLRGEGRTHRSRVDFNGVRRRIVGVFDASTSPPKE